MIEEKNLEDKLAQVLLEVKEEARLLSQLIDRIDAKQMGSIVITSNKELADWEPLFSDLYALECTLNRIRNNAICIRFSGARLQGKEQYFNVS